TVHYTQTRALHLSLSQIFAAGQQIFVTGFNACDGAGRPATTGTGAPRTADSLMGPRKTRVSAPDADTCAGCHNQPQPGGAGDFVANVFVLAQAGNPVSKLVLNEDFSQTWLERNTLGMFGAGAIEMLGREMSDDLARSRQNAIARAKASGHDATADLTSKSV